MILKAENIAFDYSTGYPCGGHVRRKIFDGFDFAVKSGDRVGVFAPSGRGKTTLCRLLAGYMKPASGRITLEGRDVSSLKGFSPVQLIWQNPELAVDPYMKMKDVMAEAGGLTDELKSSLHIDDEWLDRYPSELSGGELQRFCIARALAPETRFLICDEITTMMDSINKRLIWDFILAEAASRNLGLIAVSHERALLDKVCSRIVELCVN